MIVVTRHKALFSLLQERGLVDDDTRVVEHATREDVEGQDVVGVLPLHLAAVAKSVTVVQLNVPTSLRGRELSLAELREYAGDCKRYIIREIPV